MSTSRNYVMGLFKEESAVVSALEALKKSQWKLHRVHGPYPSEKILHALKFKKSKVGYFTLIGGITGLVTGFVVPIFTSVQWDLIVSGKPIIAPIPFFVVGYELTILFGVLGTVLGLLLNAGIPEFKSLTLYDERCSGEHFGIIAACDPGGESGLTSFFEEQGGEVRRFDETDSKQPTT